MGKERDELGKRTPVEKEADKKADKYVRKATRITEGANLKDTLGLTDEQMELFNAKFAHSLCLKETADNKRQLHSALYIIAERFGLLRHITNVNRQIDIDELTSQILRGPLARITNNYFQEEGKLGPSSITNTANFLSSMYLECREQGTSFKESIDQRLDYIKGAFLRVNAT